MQWFFLILIGIGVAASEFFQEDLEILHSGLKYNISLVGEPKMLINRNKSLTPEAENMENNSNVAAQIFQGRLFVAWRTAPVHFAGPDTKIHIASRGSNGSNEDWIHEHTVFFEYDLREPMFYNAEGNLYFTFFQAGTNPLDFEPKGLFRILRLGPGSWTEPELIGIPGEVAWDVWSENGTLYRTSYSGNFSTPGDSEKLGQVDLYFKSSDNGIDWNHLGKESVYHGGISEVGFGFDLLGNFWGLGRNEHGDESGWGSRIFYANAGQLDEWIATDVESDVNIYESPRMFRHGNELYVVARTDPDGQFWTKDNMILNTLSRKQHHTIDLVSFSFRQHGSAIWRLNKEEKRLEKVVDLAGCGDTAFPSIIRTGNHTYTIFNYSNSLDPEHCPPNWLMGQVSPAGTIIYSQDIEFLVNEEQ